jgi:SAM-dependent methyltransferase
VDLRLEERYRSRAGAAAYARKFSRSWARRLSNWRELAMVAKALARAGRAERLLDCPCGAGRLVPVLARSARRVTALDFSPGMLREARGALGPLALPVEFVQGSVLALPFPDREFDVAVCHRLLHHLSAEERAAALAELARISRRCVVLSFANAEAAQARRRRRRGSTSCTLLSESELAAEARVHGLELELPVSRKPFSMQSIAVLRVRERGAR